jgi:anti-anti-sigma regulatory factor/anti-sigma regulatory factor (Ser/Thr protein kinase)
VLSWVISWVDQIAVVSLTGALRLDTTATVRFAVLKCLTEEPQAIVIDLAAVSGFDPLALQVFPTLARTAATWPGVELMLSGAPAEMASRLTGAASFRALAVYDDQNAALTSAATMPAPSMLRQHLPPVTSAVPATRAMVREICRHHQLVRLRSYGEVVVSELAANAVRHARTSFDVTVSHRRGCLYLAVRDADPTLVHPHAHTSEDREALGGRGLFLVEALSYSWGCLPTNEGKVVWAVLRP